MSFLNCSDGNQKLKGLVSSFSKCDKRRRYYFSLATCFFSEPAARKFLDSVLAAGLRPEEIHIYIDRRSALSIGREALTRLEKDYDGECLRVFSVSGNQLFHTKGYCISAYDDDDNLVEGCLAIGSANLTKAGLIGDNGNVESLLVTDDLDEIGRFVNYFEENYIELEDLEHFGPSEVNSEHFKLALIKKGLFTHEWSGDLKSYFAARYDLNEKGRERLQDSRFRELGFDTDAATLSKRYINLEMIENTRPVEDSGLVRNYGIECHLGHWIPKTKVVASDADERSFQQFRKKLLMELRSQIQNPHVERAISRDYDSLVELDVLDLEYDAHPYSGLVEKIDALEEEESEERLRRYWTGRTFFEFPYDCNDGQGIERVYDDFMDTIGQRKRKNRSMKAFESAIATVREGKPPIGIEAHSFLDVFDNVLK